MISWYERFKFVSVFATVFRDNCWLEYFEMCYKILLNFIETFLLSANCGPYLFGISLAWSAPSGPKILSAENSYEITKNEFALAVAMLPLGATLSSVLSGIVRSRVGTQKTTLIFTFPHFFGWLMITFANNALTVSKLF